MLKRKLQCIEVPPEPSQAQKVHQQWVEQLESMEEVDRQQLVYLMSTTLEKYTHNPATEEVAKQEKLEQIQEDLRAELPPDCMAPGEKLFYPKEGDFEGYTQVNTAYVDSFLYNDDDLIDELEEQGKMSRYYCTSPLCGFSRKVDKLNFVSHSFSVCQMDFIFDHALKKHEMEGKTVLDVGSRVGSLLYYGALFTTSTKFVGIEMTDYWVKLQKKIVKKHKLQDRVRVVAGDVFKEGAQLLEEADVVVMNNVFEWFAEDQSVCFKKLRKLLKKSGTILITNPAMEESVDMGQPELKDWVRPVDLPYPRSPGVQEGGEEPNEEFEAVQSIHKYVVI